MERVHRQNGRAANYIDITGQRFGQLVALKPLGRTGGARGGFKIWLVRCDCGQKIEVTSGNLRSGNSKRCRLCSNKNRPVKHGESTVGHHTGAYRSWLAMRKRCYDPNNDRYHRYGGRGIKVCKRWDDYKKFLADMGPRPEGHYSIERINPDGNYTPKNCMWLPRWQNVKKRKVS